MTSSLPSLIAVWTLVLWLLGWLVLPVSRRVFAGLPDGGLAAGRIAFVVLVALIAFVGASVHVVPLWLAPAIAVGCAVGCALFWRDLETRIWARENWRALAFSDAVFLGCWALFLWIRLRYPDLADTEKPMDAALLSAAWKAEWLPFSHPWWGGAKFTNYYYFGPLMGALMGRALHTAPHLAYNLVQPAFCAFFLSTLWPLGAALTRSRAWGVIVVALVGLCGPLEPLRQFAEKGWHWPLDAFATSRVIANTINEYPAFTLTIGDAHAHFYALSLAALWISLAWSLFANAEINESATAESATAESATAESATAESVTAESANAESVDFKSAKSKRAKRKKKGAKKKRESEQKEAKIANVGDDSVVWGARKPRSPRRFIIGIGGLVLGAWLMTNTWDAPVFGLLFGLAIWMSRPAGQPKIRAFAVAVAPFVVAIAVAALYFWRFRSTVRGAEFALWQPDGFSFALMWGGWIMLGALAFLLPAPKSETAQDAPDSAARFRRLLVGAGLVALLAPFAFYIRDGFSGGDYRHMNTVFKFGLQAWILLGLGLSAELGARVTALRPAPKRAVVLALALLAPVLALGTATTIWVRAGAGVARVLSLNGIGYLPAAQQDALKWLQTHGRAGEIAMEPVPLGDDGAPGGDYDGNWGIVGAFSGLSSTLGWPQHVWDWGGDYGAVAERGRQIAALYARDSPLQTARGAAHWNTRYVFFGAGNWQTPNEAQARAAGWTIHQFDGQDGSRALVLERIES